MGTRIGTFRNARRQAKLGMYDGASSFLGLPDSGVLQHLLRDRALRAPAFAGIYLYVKFPQRYVRWLLTFLFIPCSARSGGSSSLTAEVPPERYGFVDTPRYFNFGRGRLLWTHGEPNAETIASSATCTRACRPPHHVRHSGPCSPCGRSSGDGGSRRSRVRHVPHRVVDRGHGEPPLDRRLRKYRRGRLAYLCAVGVDRVLDWLRSRRSRDDGARRHGRPEPVPSLQV